MELSIRPSAKNHDPLGALIIRGASVAQWLQEMQAMNLSLQAVAGPCAGFCLGLFGRSSLRQAEDRHRPQRLLPAGTRPLVHPERASLYPMLSAEEVAKLFGGKRHLFHPEIGLVELEEPVDWTTVIEPPVEAPHRLKKPAATPFVPMQVKTFGVKPVAAEEALQAFDEKHFAQNQKFS